jgi:hypothetical protein
MNTKWESISLSPTEKIKKKRKWWGETGREIFKKKKKKKVFVLPIWFGYFFSS